MTFTPKPDFVRDACAAVNKLPEFTSVSDAVKAIYILEVALSDAYARGLEDAAAIADKRSVGGYYHGSPEWADGPEIAAEIRALGSK